MQTVYITERLYYIVLLIKNAINYYNIRKKYINTLKF